MAQSLTNQLVIDGKPVDERIVVENVEAIRTAQGLYVGLIVYAKAEDKVFIVKSLKNGYLDLASHQTVVDKPAGEEGTDYEVVPNAFVDVYAEITGASAVAAVMSIKVNEKVYNAADGVVDLSDIDAASVGGYKFVVMTQAEYDEVTEKDPNVFYAVSDAVDKIDETATYENLNTTDKTIIGAINELKAAIAALSAS